VGTSQVDKEKHHDRIVAIAATLVRERGLDGIGVAELMKEAGLTHGGFYRHFGSREDLVDEAVERALGEGTKRVESGPKPSGKRELSDNRRRVSLHCSSQFPWRWMRCRGIVRRSSTWRKTRPPGLHRPGQIVPCDH
jgi:AcrR family transcriptional regulator